MKSSNFSSSLDTIRQSSAFQGYWHQKTTYKTQYSPLSDWMFPLAPVGTQICFKKSTRRTRLCQFALSRSTARLQYTREHFLLPADVQQKDICTRHLWVRCCVIGWITQEWVNCLCLILPHQAWNTMCRRGGSCGQQWDLWSWRRL